MEVDPTSFGKSEFGRVNMVVMLACMTESGCHRVHLSNEARPRSQPRCLTAFVPGPGHPEGTFAFLPTDDIGSNCSGDGSSRVNEGVGADDIPRSDEERSDGVRLSSCGFGGSSSGVARPRC